MTRPLPRAALAEMAAADARTVELARAGRVDRRLETTGLIVTGLLVLALLVGAVACAGLVLAGLLMLAVTVAAWVPWPVVLVAGGLVVGGLFVRAGTRRDR